MASLPMSAKQEMLDLMTRFKREKLHPHIDIEGFSPSELNVTLCVYVAQKQELDLIQPSHVAQWLHLTPSALSQTLKVLEQKALIVRKRSQKDSRSVSLELTPEGMKLAQKCAEERDCFMNDLIEYLGEEEVKRLIKSFNKIFDFMSARCSKSASDKETVCE